MMVVEAVGAVGYAFELRIALAAAVVEGDGLEVTRVGNDELDSGEAAKAGW